MIENRKKLAVWLAVLFLLNILLILLMTSPALALNAAENEIELLARLISAESDGGSYPEQAAIGGVVINRLQHPDFPNTLAGVIYQNGAFAGMQNGRFWRSVSEGARRAAEDALNGWDPSGGALYYYEPGKAENTEIENRPIITQIGRLVFCS